MLTSLIEDRDVRDRRSDPAMRDRRARLAFLGLILAFPVLIALTTGKLLDRETMRTVFGVDAILICGLVFVARSRRDLLAPQPVPRKTLLGPSRLQSLQATATRPVAVGYRRRPG
jgi:hypothetical protein